MVILLRIIVRLTKLMLLHSAANSVMIQHQVKFDIFCLFMRSHWRQFPGSLNGNSGIIDISSKAASPVQDLLRKVS